MLISSVGGEVDLFWNDLINIMCGWVFMSTPQHYLSFSWQFDSCVQIIKRIIKSVIKKEYINMY